MKPSIFERELYDKTDGRIYTPRDGIISRSSSKIVPTGRVLEITLEQQNDFSYYIQGGERINAGENVIIWTDPKKDSSKVLGIHVYSFSTHRIIYEAVYSECANFRDK